MSLMGILSGRVFGKTGAVWVCGALFLCAAGAVRMEMAEEIWRQQSQYIVGSEGTFCGIVAEEPSAASLQRNLLWTKGRTDMPGTLLI